MSFVKYSSLENHTNSKFLEKIIDAIRSGEIDNNFVAREKIHGTNFSVIITKDSIQPAKRSGVIDVTENFFGWQDLMSKYSGQFKTIQQTYFATPYENDVIQIFGEYAGGGIQKEVDYGEKDFYVFDIMINGKYVSDDIVEDFTVEYDFNIAPLIGRGKLEDLLKLPVEFDSIINTYNNTNALGRRVKNKGVYKQSEPKDNVAEGLVIKPIEPSYLANGSRVAIKYKTDAFKEKGKGKAPKLPTPMTEKDVELATKFSEYITENRLSNVLSHIGEVTTKDFGKVMGLMMKDIFAESKREGVTIDVADSPSKVSKEIQHQVTTLIRSKWVDIISK